MQCGRTQAEYWHCPELRLTTLKDNVPTTPASLHNEDQQSAATLVYHSIDVTDFEKTAEHVEKLVVLPIDNTDLGVFKIDHRQRIIIPLKDIAKLVIFQGRFMKAEPI